MFLPRSACLLKKRVPASDSVWAAIPPLLTLILRCASCPQRSRNSANSRQLTKSRPRRCRGTACPPEAGQAVPSGDMNALTQFDTLPQRDACAPGRVAVAMSGGVDSSTVAALLQEQGREVIGLTMQLWNQRRL